MHFRLLLTVIVIQISARFRTFLRSQPHGNIFSCVLQGFSKRRYLPFNTVTPWFTPKIINTRYANIFLCVDFTCRCSCWQTCNILLMSVDLGHVCVSSIVYLWVSINALGHEPKSSYKHVVHWSQFYMSIFHARSLTLEHYCFNKQLKNHLFLLCDEIKRILGLPLTHCGKV